jgi:hypothetical protein
MVAPQDPFAGIFLKGLIERDDIKYTTVKARRTEPAIIVLIVAPVQSASPERPLARSVWGLSQTRKPGP